MHHALAALLLSASAAQAAPLLVPLRDVTVEYAVTPRDHAPLDVHVAIEAGGRHLRVTSAELPTAFIVDRPEGVATILLPMLKLYATVGVGAYDPERTVLRGARFERHNQHSVAGLVCTEWTAASAQGQAQACITVDGVILQGQAADRHGLLGRVRATRVQFGALDPVLFRRPEDYSNAGSLPLDGFGGGAP